MAEDYTAHQMSQQQFDMETEDNLAFQALEFQKGVKGSRPHPYPQSQEAPIIAQPDLYQEG